MLSKFCIMLTLLIFLFEAEVYAKPDCKIHKVYCSILKLRKDIDLGFAMELSNSIYKWSKYYEMDPVRSVAILMQESYLGHFKNRVIQGVIKKEKCVLQPKKLFVVNSTSIDEFYIDPHAEWCMGDGCTASNMTDVKSEMKCSTSYEVKDVLADLSIWQFQPYTAIEYGMDLARLQNDLDYATQQHFRLMRIKYDYPSCNRKWPKSKWACYHSMTEKHHLQYVEDVNRWYIKIAS